MSNLPNRDMSTEERCVTVSTSEAAFFASASSSGALLAFAAFFFSESATDTKRENRKSLKGALAGLKTLVEKTRKFVHKVDLKYEPIHNDQYKKAEAFTSLKKDLDELEAMLPRMRQAAAILALDDNVKPSEDAPPKV